MYGHFVTSSHFNKEKMIASESNIDLMQSHSKTFTICVKETELERRKLELDVKISLVENVTKSYETGVLFWKKKHYVTNDVSKGAKKVTVSIIG